MTTPVTIVGGGIAGLVAAITCAESGVAARIVEARQVLGGRGRSTAGPYVANLGPHALYTDGPLWSWLVDRRLTPLVADPPLAAGIRWHVDGTLRHTPPAAELIRVLMRRGEQASADLSFRSWLSALTNERAAELWSGAAGVFAFTHDPGALSAAFVWDRIKRVLLTLSPAARYPLGGWTALIDRLAHHARALGVDLQTGRRLTSLPEPPVVVATDMPTSRQLLGDPALKWPSGHVVCLDLGLRSRRGDPFIVSDLSGAGWVERYTAADRSFAPSGEELVQAQLPPRPDETTDEATTRLEGLLDLAFEGWRSRVTWRRRLVMKAQTGALDFPGLTWRDRPAVDRGDGVFLAGDMVAAPGLLAEVAFNSGVKAAQLAVQHVHNPFPVNEPGRTGAVSDPRRTSVSSPVRSWP